MFDGVKILCLLLYVFTQSYAGNSGAATEQLTNVLWFGDERGAPTDDIHYDVFYDEQVCDTELVSTAIENYAFHGEQLEKLKAFSSADCIRLCFLNKKCRSANYVKPIKRPVGQCRLYGDAQTDHPERLVKRERFVYLDRIKCSSDTEASSTSRTSTAIPKPTKTTVIADPNVLSDFLHKLKKYYQSQQPVRA